MYIALCVLYRRLSKHFAGADGHKRFGGLSTNYALKAIAEIPKARGLGIFFDDKKLPQAFPIAHPLEMSTNLSF